MSFVTVPKGMGNILDDLKSVYEKLKPTIKEASAAYKQAKKGGGGEVQVIDAGVPAPTPPQYYPPRGGMMDSIPTWAIYAGIGVAVFAILSNRSK
jgi:hypothetical protein